MKQSGDYFHPTINGQLYFDKPVGSYWLILAASFFTGAVNEATARLPAALAGVVGVWVVILLGRRLFDDWTAVIAGAVLATSFGFAFYARRATADIETVTGVLVAVWLFARHIDGPIGAWVIGLWVWMAAVSLTKGLLGFALPIAVFFTYGVWSTWATWDERATGRGWLAAFLESNRWLFNCWTIAAVPIAVGVYLLPFLLAAFRTGDWVGLEMVWRENVQRFVAPHNHTGPVWLYLGAIFLLAAPWAVFLPAAVLPPTSQSRTAGDRLARSYFWGVFLFFTVSASRRSYYLLPVLPATALLIGRLLAAGSANLTLLARRLRTSAWVLMGVGGVLTGLLLLPPAVALTSPYDQLPTLPARGWLACGWLISLLGTLIAIVCPNSPRVAMAVIWAFAVFVFGFVIVYPAVDDFRSRRAFLADVRVRTAADADRLGLFDARDTVFEIGRILPEYTSKEELKIAADAGRVRWVILPRRRLTEISRPAAVVVEERVQPWEQSRRLDNKLLLVEMTPPSTTAGYEKRP
jgi:4-amino-4-deoxy-L-arabinose transferase-like glycosyltransferase